MTRFKVNASNYFFLIVYIQHFINMLSVTLLFLHVNFNVHVSSYLKIFN